MFQAVLDAVGGLAVLGAFYCIATLVGICRTQNRSMSVLHMRLERLERRGQWSLDTCQCAICRQRRGVDASAT